MKRPNLFTIGLIGASILGFSALTSALPAHAVPTAPKQTTNTGGQALEIAPPVVNISADPGQTVKTQISLRDVSSGPLIVTGQVNDFVAGDENGTPKILLDDSQSNPYSLKSWLTGLPDLTLEPRQIKNLPVTIHVPANAAPGGYYGIVRFTATPPELKNTGVSLSASLGALVLLKVNGTVKENLTVADFWASKIGAKATVFQNTPITFNVRLKNNGNIHEVPEGQVVITDMFGKKVAGVNINLPPRNILPNSIRAFDAPLDSAVIGDRILFGRYTATLNMTYGANKQVVTSQIVFWVIPYTLIGGGIIALVGGFILLRFLGKRYNRHIIAKAEKSRRK